MKKHITLIIILFVGLINYAQSFQNIDFSLPNLNSSATAFGDVDNDGDLDLFISGSNASSALEGGLYIYDNDSYTLSTTTNLPLVSYGSVRFGDINNDGNLDILISGFDVNYTGLTDVFINNADGTFTALNAGLPPTYLSEVAFADFDNDGNLDIAIVGSETNTYTDITKLFRNNGDNTFTELTNVVLPGMSLGRIKFADYNNDGFQDFVLNGFGDGDQDVATANSYYTQIYTNNQDLTFTKSSIGLEGLWIGDIEWADYNSDGFQDLVISGTGGNTGAEKMTKIYKNNGDSTFTDINAGLLGTSHNSIEWADFDNDDDLDLLITGAYTIDGSSSDGFIASIYLNDGEDVFSLSDITSLTSSHYGDVATGDFDNDGKIDIIITGFDENDQPATNVYQNTTILGLNTIVILDKITIYPNPSYDRIINIDLGENMNDNTISIYSLDGKQVLKTNLINTKKVDLTSLTSGMYLLKVTSKNSSITRKIVLD